MEKIRTYHRQEEIPEVTLDDFIQTSMRFWSGKSEICQNFQQLGIGRQDQGFAVLMPSGRMFVVQCMVSKFSYITHSEQLERLFKDCMKARKESDRIEAMP